uniref:Uncharacterized protein n=1 Tax=Anguilla anguilla TaxID=7936 RepID=A0A0E9W0Q2_ANGAN
MVTAVVCRLDLKSCVCTWEVSKTRIELHFKLDLRLSWIAL